MIACGRRDEVMKREQTSLLLVKLVAAKCKKVAQQTIVPVCEAHAKHEQCLRYEYTKLIH